MNRRELKDYVLGLLSQHCDEYTSTFRDISLVTSNPERTDRYGRRLEELFREGYGVVTKDTADYRVPLYVFTGKIYEYMDYNVLYDAVDRWLEKMGVAARDRTNKNMYAYMNRIINVIRDHELQPDLSIMCFTNCVVDMNRLKVYPHSPKFDCVKMYPSSMTARRYSTVRHGEVSLGRAGFPLMTWTVSFRRSTRGEYCRCSLARALSTGRISVLSISSYCRGPERTARVSFTGF